jgi:transcriptional regulator with XRE-family HTH domain
MKTLAERLKEAREDKGWKKADLMRAAGINSRSTLTQLENGTIFKSPQLPSIAAALGVEVLWLQLGRGQKRRGLINSSINDPVCEAVIQDPCAEYLAKLPPNIAAKLRLDIKHAYERWELEQKDTGYSAEWIQTGEGDPKLSQSTDKLNTLSARLIEARTDKGWNKTELKKAAGLKSASTLTDLESGARTQSPQLPLIADALGVEVLWLQHGKGQKKRGLINASRSDYTEPVPSSAHDPILDTLEKMPECLRNKIRILARHALEAWQLEQIATGVGISSADLLTDSLAMDKSKLGYDLGRVDLRTSTLIGRLVEDFFRSSSANRHRILQLASECATKG